MKQTIDTTKQEIAGNFIESINDLNDNENALYCALEMLSLNNFMNITMRHTHKLNEKAHEVIEAEQNMRRLITILAAATKGLRVACSDDNKVLLFMRTSLLAEFESLEKFHDFYVELDESITA